MLSNEEREFIQNHHRDNTLTFTNPKSGFVHELTQKIVQLTPFVDKAWKSSFKYRLWHLVNDKDQAVCQECGDPVKPTLYGAFDWANPYPEVCSKTCNFILRAKQVHGDTFDYDKAKYTKAHGKVTITCPTHGDFEQIAHNHLNGSGCVECRNDSFKTAYLKPHQDRIDEFRAVHGDRYDYSQTTIEGNSHQHITVICQDHGPFQTTPLRHAWAGHGCPKCSYTEGSSQERFICQLLDECGIEYEQNNRSILGGQEIDIVIHDQRLAIEIDGIYWHSTRFRDKWYHQAKTEACRQNGYDLIHFFDVEIDLQPDLIRSMLMSRLGMAKAIHARKCRVVRVGSDESIQFQQTHHLYNPIQSAHRYGLEHDGELVALMTFSRARTGAYGDDAYELVRYANRSGYRVVGGASRLLTAFERDVSPTTIVSYSDMRYSTGGLYRSLGFHHSHNSDPSPKFWKSKADGLISRNRLQKHKLTHLPAYADDKTADQILDESGYYKVYDCGHGVWIKQ